jgi:hypothetical protein
LGEEYKTSNLIIDKKQIKLLTQKKALPPTLKAQLKLHKTDIPICPLINNRTVPAYKLARYLTKTLDQYISLNNYFSVAYCTNLANDITMLEIHENHRMICFYIKDLYVNIPTDETLNVTKAKLLQNNNIQMTYQMLSLLKVILSQNYFMLQQKIYQPAQGISVGSTISRLIDEIFLQHYEDANIKQLLYMKSIALCVRYVDVILVIYDTTKINLYTINTYINKIHNNIKLNPTNEEHNSIAFLDLTIRRRHAIFEVDIHRKPTTTDTTINFLSNHPIEQKMVAFRFHITRMHSLPLNPDKRQTEWEIIQSMAKNNNFPQRLLLKLNQQIMHEVNNNNNNNNNNKNNNKTSKNDKKIWTTFTFHSP